MALNLARPVDYRQQSVDFSPLANIGLAYAGQQQRRQQQERQQQLVSQAQEIAGTGDVNAMRDFAIANPELGKTMFEFGGIADEQAQNRMSNLTKSLVSSATPVQDLKEYIEQGRQAGRDMTHSEKLLQQSEGDPEKLKRMTEMSLAVQDPAAFNAIQKTKPQAPESMTEYQQAMIDSKKIDQDLRREEAILKREENKLKRETDELKREELKNKIDDSRQKIEDAKRSKSEAIQTSVDASKSLLSSIDQLAGNEGYLNSLTGYRGRLPASATDEGVEAEALFDNITNSLTLDNLKLMTGVLTDKDIELLRSAASGLKKGMGTDRFKEILSTIRGKVESGLKMKQGAEPETTQQTYSEGTVIRNPSTGATMVMINGEWVNG